MYCRPSPDQIVAARKLLDALHPAATGLQGALDATVPLCAVIAVVRADLAKNQFFPPDWRPEPLGDGAIIERRGKHLYLVHERSEVGQLRYSEVSSRSCVFLRSAVLRYLRHYRALLKVKQVHIKKWS